MWLIACLYVEACVPVLGPVLQADIRIMIEDSESALLLCRVLRLISHLGLKCAQTALRGAGWGSSDVGAGRGDVSSAVWTSADLPTSGGGRHEFNNSRWTRSASSSSCFRVAGQHAVLRGGWHFISLESVFELMMMHPSLTAPGKEKSESIHCNLNLVPEPRCSSNAPSSQSCHNPSLSMFGNGASHRATGEGQCG